MEWISVKDRLPTGKDVQCLAHVITYGVPGIRRVRYVVTNEGEFWLNIQAPDPVTEPYKEVTHWMPLPDYPAEWSYEEWPKIIEV